MKKVHVWCFAMVFVCFALLTGQPYAADKVIKLEMSSYFPPQDPNGITIQEWCKDLAKRTDGRIVVTFHPGGTLVSPTQTYEATANGIVDIGHSAFGYTTGRFPMMELLDLPTGLKTAVSITRLTYDYVDRFKPKELQDVKILMFFGTTPAHIHTKKPIRRLDDLKGMKIRTIGGSMVDLVQDLGAVPVVMPAVNVYDAASKGIIDGALSAWPGVGSFKLGEVFSCTVDNVSTGAASINYIVMNKEKWDALPADLKGIMQKSCDEYAVKIAQSVDKYSDDVARGLIAAKHVITTLSSQEEERWYKAIEPVFAKYIAEKGAKGLPAADAHKFIQEWAKKNPK